MRQETVIQCANEFLGEALDRMGLGDEERLLLRTPRREVQCELPLRRDDGSLRVHRGFRVQHDNARGPFKGGLRYHPEASMDHFRGLAQLMTWKTALVNIPFGGAKGGIDCDPHELSLRELEILTKRLTWVLSPIIGPDTDIMGPDMGTGAREMAWIYHAYAQKRGDRPAVVSGKPVQLGGSALRAFSTGLGVAMVTAWAAPAAGIDLAGADVAIQGFGNVGRHAARFLTERHARVVAVSDHAGGVFHPDGLPIERMLAAKGFRDAAPDDARELSNPELLELDVDILIPAAVEGVIDADRAGGIRAGMVVEAANAPVTGRGDRLLRDRGITIVPDILANAGGVIVSYLEWIQSRQRFSWPHARVQGELRSILAAAWEDVAERGEQLGSYRLAGYEVAARRVKESIDLRGF